MEVELFVLFEFCVFVSSDAKKSEEEDSTGEAEEGEGEGEGEEAAESDHKDDSTSNEVERLLLSKCLHFSVFDHQYCIIFMSHMFSTPKTSLICARFTNLRVKTSHMRSGQRNRCH